MSLVVEGQDLNDIGNVGGMEPIVADCVVDQKSSENKVKMLFSLHKLGIGRVVILEQISVIFLKSVIDSNKVGFS